MTKDLAERLRRYAATCTQKPCAACVLVNEAADALDRLSALEQTASEVESGSEGVTDDGKLDATIYVESRRRALTHHFKDTMAGPVFSDYYERWREEMEGAYLAGRKSALASAAKAEARVRELEITVSQLRCETSAYRIDLKRLLSIERRLKEAIGNSDASICDIVAPNDLREILHSAEEGGNADA